MWQFYWALMLLFEKICGKVIVGNLSGEELVGNILPASRFIPQCLLEAWKVQVSFPFIRVERTILDVNNNRLKSIFFPGKPQPS